MKRKNLRRKVTINSISLSASTLADCTIGSQYITEKETAKEGGRYNSTARCYYNGGLPNGRICLKITLWFLNVCNRFNKKACYCKILAVTALQRILTPSLITVEMFALVVPCLFAVCFVNNNYECLGQNIAAMIPFVPISLYKNHDLS